MGVLAGNESGVVVRADVEPREFSRLMQAIGGAAGLEGVLLGNGLALTGHGLRGRASQVRNACGDTVRVVYGPQLVDSSIENATLVSEELSEAGVHAAILQQSDPKRPEDLLMYVDAMHYAQLGVIVAADPGRGLNTVRIGRRLDDQTWHEMFEPAVDCGVTDFMMGCSESGKIRPWQEHFARKLGVGRFALWVNNFVAGDGELYDAYQAAGENLHVVVDGYSFPESPGNLRFALDQVQVGLSKWQSQRQGAGT